MRTAAPAGDVDWREPLLAGWYDFSVTLTEMARRLGIAPGAVYRRLDRLRAEGVEIEDRGQLRTRVVLILDRVCGSVTEIVELSAIARRTVERILREEAAAGVEVVNVWRPRRRPDPEELIEAWRSDLTGDELGERFGLHRGSVYVEIRKLREEGYDVGERPAGRRRRTATVGGIAPPPAEARDVSPSIATGRQLPAALKLMRFSGAQLTRREMAERLGVSVGTVHRWRRELEAAGFSLAPAHVPVEPAEVLRLNHAGLLQREIAARLGVDQATIHRRLNDLEAAGHEIRRGVGGRRVAVDVDELLRLTREEGTQAAVAAKLGVSAPTVRRRLEELAAQVGGR